MPTGPSALPGDGSEAYARAVGRVACAQVIYARAERLAAHEARVAAKFAKASDASASASTPRPASKKILLNPSTVFVSESVADALADVVAAFITHVGRRSVARASLSGRTQPAFTDVLAILDDASSFTRSHTRDLALYAEREEVAFPSPVPPFPLPVSRAGVRMVGDAMYVAPDPGVEAQVDAGAMPWIEPWMPPLPPKRTYMATPGVVTDAGKPTGVAPDRATVSRQRRQVEQSLARLKERDQAQRSGGLSDAATAVARLGHVPATHALAQNPFLAPPVIGKSHPIDEEKVSGQRRDIGEPADVVEVDGDGDTGMRDTNKATDGNDPKRARVSRILNEGKNLSSVGGTTAGAGASGAGAGASSGGGDKKGAPRPSQLSSPKQSPKPSPFKSAPPKKPNDAMDR